MKQSIAFRPWLLALAIVLLLGLIACGEKTPNYAAGDSVPAHESFTLDSRIMGEKRPVNVYLPPDYVSHRDQAFPVLYMPDGGLREDFPHLATTIDELIRANAMQPVILVGVANTQRRRDMTPPTEVKSDREIAPQVGQSARFRAFFRDELMPEIKRRYRVNAERGLIGESLAGLFVVENLLREPGLFDKHIALSPSLWWNREKLITQAADSLRGLPPKPIALYLAAANEEDIAPQATRLAQVLKEAAPANLHWQYHPRPDLRHNTIYRALKRDALKALYPPET